MRNPSHSKDKLSVVCAYTNYQTYSVAALTLLFFWISKRRGRHRCAPAISQLSHQNGHRWIRATSQPWSLIDHMN